MAGQLVPIGGRVTYLPPFVNERFDGPPFWACTYASLLNGANVAWLGQKPATHTEVAALAGASGDRDTRHGSRARHMIRAIRVRYGQKIALDNVSAAEAQRRLASGWALVAGVTYGELPTRYRRWSPRFKLGHRVTIVGFSNGRTRLLDPLANRDSTYGGEWIAWSDFARGWWSDEQLWFKEGAFAGPGNGHPAEEVDPKTGQPQKSVPGVDIAASPRILRRFAPVRHFRVAATSTVVAYAPGNPPVVARRLRFPHASGALFDAVVTFDPAVKTFGDPGRAFLHITKGAFAGRYIEVGAQGIAADISPDAAPAPGPAPVDLPAPGQVEVQAVPGSAEATLAAAILEGRRAEWDRISQATAGIVLLPPRP